ncbi:ricin B-like lectin EULS3 isoform X2 [Impatiens glandulifera]|nr:ricin B-like lectin EULS3 isoform X2 [Impatiens glandulifera]
MDYPRGHQSYSHNHHRRDDDENDADRYPPPPRRPTADDEDFPPPSHRPPSFGRPTADDDFPPPSHRPPPPSNYYDPSPPPYHSNVNAPPPVYNAPPPAYNNYNAPPPAYNNYNAPPPPHTDYSSSSVHHVSHDPPPHTEIPQPASHHHRPHFPSFHHDDNKLPEPSSEFSSKPPVRVYSKAETNYSLTISQGKVVLTPSNPSDPYQQWIKDEKYSTKVKDEEGFPSFALVNKATGEALKHSIGATHPVQLTPYVQNVLDESVLWTLSRDLGDGYRTIRMVNNIRLNVDAFNGDQKHGGVRDGTTIVLWEWKKGDNQRWKIAPY